MESIFSPYIGLGNIIFAYNREVIRKTITKEFIIQEMGEGEDREYIDAYNTPFFKLYYNGSLSLEAIEIFDLVPILFRNFDIRRSKNNRVIMELARGNLNYVFSKTMFISLEYGTCIVKEDGLFKKADSAPDAIVLFRKGYYDQVIAMYPQQFHQENVLDFF